MNDVEGISWTSVKESPAESGRITRKRLIDSLNYVNFQKNSVVINFTHVVHHNMVSLRAYPQPCSGDVLSCLWAEDCPAGIASNYVFQNIVIDRASDLLVVDAQPMHVTSEGITFMLPESCRSFSMRETVRHDAKGINVIIVQDDMVFSCTLGDFTSTAFRLIASPQAYRILDKVNPKQPVRAVFMDGDTMLFTGWCRLVRQVEAGQELVFRFRHAYEENPSPWQISSNNNGHRLAPLPNVTFNHPLSGRRVNLKTEEVSASWFSVVEHYERSVLFPGLVIPRVEIEFMPGFSVTCEARVGYREVSERNGGNRSIKWRMTILDMSIEDQGRLFSLLQRARYEEAYACSRIDPEDMLKFFFDTGLVYPKKYAALQLDRERFRKTYERLYLNNPAITRHYIHMEKGVIHGHLSMIRFYENTWLLHHHAALGMRAAGLAVLRQAKDYVNDCRELRSSHMDYLICYFRPDNKFPERVFGGFSRTLANPKHCSVDYFAYLSFNLNSYSGREGCNRWELYPTKTEDLLELSSFYAGLSGGLMLKALDLESRIKRTDTLNNEYRKLGFKRERLLFSLKKDGVLKAVIMAVVSDAGLNLSNLTNCIHVFVLNGEGLSVDMVYRHLAMLSGCYEEDEIPVLLYPLYYVVNQSIAYDKVYKLWAFDTKNTEKFYEYMDSLVCENKNSGEDKICHGEI